MAGLLVASEAMAAPGQESSAQGTASVEIIQPLQVENRADLQFGVVTGGLANGGEVYIDPATGTAHYSGSATPACQQGAECMPRPALFHISGSPGRTYRISLPSSVLARPDHGSALELVVRDLISWSRELSLTGETGQLGSAGTDEVQVGGTLEIPAGAQAARYQAEVNIVVTYH